MKTVVSAAAKRLERLGFFLIAACLFVAPTARAGLSIDLLMYHTADGYDCDATLSTNSTPPDAPLGWYVMSSPGDVSHTEYQAGTNSFGIRVNIGRNFLEFDQFIQAVTSGDWTITVTNATSTNVYAFSVTATGFTSNLFSAPVEVTFPSEGAINVTNQPLFTWQGPSPWGGDIEVSEYNSDFTFFQDEYLPPSQTSWISPEPLPNGGNTFGVIYTSNATPFIVASTPLNTNATAAPISGWVSTASLQSYSFVDFDVSSVAVGAGGHTLLAYYPFDDGNLAATDVTGNGNGLGPPFDFNGGSAAITNDAAAGLGAVSFNNAGGSGEAFYFSSNPQLLSALGGSFSISLRLKTTQVSGSATDDGIYNNAGIVSAFQDPDMNAVIPMSITGSNLAFVTIGGGGSEQDTLHSVSPINTGQYVHLVVTRDQATGRKSIYINGMLDSSDTATTDDLTGPTQFDIGSNNGNGFDGEMDDIQVYAGVLSAGDVLQLYNAPGTTVPNTTSVPGLDVALNATNLTWTSGGDAPWFVETDVTHDGVSAAQSGLIADTQTNWIETTVPSNGQVSFYWKVSSEQDADYLIFFINGVKQDALSGETDWNQKTNSVSAGDTLRWEYVKNSGDSEGADAGWVDQVQYTIPAPAVSVEFYLEVLRFNDQIHGSSYYEVYPDITLVSPAPGTTDRIESFDGAISSVVYAGDSSGDAQTPEYFNSLEDLIHACTNGQWTLYVNQGDPSEHRFYFTVSVNGLTTNLLSATTILVPAANATDVATNSPFQWSGSADFSNVFVEAYREFPTFALDGFQTLVPTATNWPSPPSFFYGTNFAEVQYGLYDLTNVVFSTPMDAALDAVSGWDTTVEAYSTANSLFVVGAPAPLPVSLNAAPQPGGGGFQLSFQTLAGRPHTIQVRTNLTSGLWTDVSNFVGDGALQQFTFPTTNGSEAFFRVVTQ